MTESLPDRMKIKPPERLIEVMLVEVNGESRNCNEAVISVESEEWKTVVQEEMDALVEKST